MTTHPDAVALLTAIIDDPADDLPRLAFADWLDEQGENDRAEFIRVQVAGEGGFGAFTRIYQALSVELLSAFPPWRFLGFAAELEGERKGLPYIRFGVKPVGSFESSAILCWRRGFMSDVRCPLQSWLEHGPAIVRRHPVERVELADKGPAEIFDDNGDHVYGWYRACPPNDEDECDNRIWSLINLSKLEAGAGWKVAPSTALALDAFSDALIAWAKAEPSPV